MRIRPIWITVISVSAAAAALGQTPLGSGFTYQGQLKQGGQPLTGSADLQFALYDALTGGNLLGSESFPGASIMNGLITVVLNAGGEFGANAFNGEARWLEIAVNGTTLAPRQELTAAPNALFALNAATATNATQLNGQGSSFYQNASNIAQGLLSSAFGGTGLNTSAVSTGSLLYTSGVGLWNLLPPGSNTQVLTLSGGVPTWASPGGGLSLPFAGTTNVGLGSAAFKVTNTGIGYSVVGQSDGSSGTGVFGNATATVGAATGVYGQCASANGYGVYGFNSATTGTTFGGSFQSNSTNGRGVYGAANASTGVTYGVEGITNSSSSGAAGVYGEATATPQNPVTATVGVWGRTDSQYGFGVYGEAASCCGIGLYGVYGYASTGPLSSYAVYAAGRLTASGTKSFRIDHPDDPENKYLLHYSIESPEVLNAYSGKATLDAAGEAVVELPHYFAKINKDPRYTLTAVGAPMPMLHVAEEIDEAALSAGAKAAPGEAAIRCTFRIAGGAPGKKVSWEVKAVRNDKWVQQCAVPVEVEKQGRERGTYQHPEFYGQPKEKGMNYHAEHERPSPLAPAAAPGPRVAPPQ